MTQDRALKIVLHMMTLRYQTTGKQLAAKFDVSLRTIYRDMALLQLLGFPIAGKTGNKHQDGGYWWKPDAEWEAKNKQRTTPTFEEQRK